MDLWQLAHVMKRRWWIVAIGVVVGTALAFLSLYSVTRAPAGQGGSLRISRRSNTTYKTTLNILVDTPGFGAGRIDVSMAKPTQMAPTFAYLAASDQVMGTVIKREPLRDKTEILIAPVDGSPVFQIQVIALNAAYARHLASAIGQEFVKYMGKQYDANTVPEAMRMVFSPLGAPSKAAEVQSRDVEMAVILFALPLLFAVGLAAAVDGASRRVSLERERRAAEEETAREESEKRVPITFAALPQRSGAASSATCEGKTVP